MAWLKHVQQCKVHALSCYYIGPHGLGMESMAWAAWAIEEQATQIHRVWALQVQDSAAAEVEPARRKAVSVKVELGCNCSRESAQVERAHMHLIE